MKNNKLSFCVSLTTIPPRAGKIKKTLDSIYNQTRKANKIFLNIPSVFKRFPEESCDISCITNLYKNLEIVSCEDFGPGTKLLGSIDKLKNYDYVVLVDDDHIYNKEMLDFFYQKAILSLERSYSFCVSQIEDCKVGQGADGFLINSNFLKNIFDFFQNQIKNNQKLFYNDDLWISIFLNKILKIDIENISYLLKKSFFKKNKSIYKKHTTIESLIEVYSKNRKSARKLRFEENCKEYLLLKNKTKDFTVFEKN